jgi:hypothetical protein
VFSLLEWDSEPAVCFAAVSASPGDSKRGYRRLASDPRLAANDAWIGIARFLDEATVRESPLWGDPRFRAAVAEDARTPDLQRGLRRDTSKAVRLGLARNVDCIDSVLSALTGDSEPDVAKAAKDNLKSRKRLRRQTSESGDSLADHALVGRAVSELRTLDGDMNEVLTRLAHLSAPFEDSRLLRQLWIPASALADLVTERQRQFHHVVEAVASNVSTPPNALSRIASGVWGDHAVGSALANPSFDLDQLVRYATGSGDGVKFGGWQEAIWSNPSLPESLMFGKPKAVAAKVGLARNASAPAFMLAHLAKDDDIYVRCAVAENAATPAASLAMLADSNLNDLLYGIAHALLRNSATPREAFVALSKHQELRALVASSPSAPVDLLDELSSDADVRVRAGVAHNPTTRSSTIAAFANDDDLKERHKFWELERHERIARLREEQIESRALPRPGSKEQAAAVFIHAFSARFRENLASGTSHRWMAEAEFVQSVLVSDPLPRVRRSIAIFGDDLLRRQLAHDDDDDVVHSVAFSTTDPTLAELLVAREPARLGLAFNPVTPAHVLTEIARLSPGKVQEQLAEHPHSAPELLARLIAGGADGTASAVQVRVAQSAAVDVATLLALSMSESAETRQQVAAHQKTPTETLAALAADDDPLTRLVVAMNWHTPSGTLGALAADSDLRVRRAVATRAGAVPDVWLRLIGDGDEIVRRVARNYSVPALEERLIMAGDPSTDPDALSFMASDPSESVRTLVAENPATPAVALDLLATAEEPSIRRSVARRLDSPEGALQVLRGDQVWAVRRAAKSTTARQRRIRS